MARISEFPDTPQIKKEKARVKEFKRAHALNDAFDTLQKKIPYLNAEERKTLPKIKTLRLTMQYISHLKKLLDGDAMTTTETNETRPLIHSDFRETVTDVMRVRNNYRERAHSQEMDRETVQRILAREQEKRRRICYSVDPSDMVGMSQNYSPPPPPPQQFGMMMNYNFHQQVNVHSGPYLPPTPPPYNTMMMPPFPTMPPQPEPYYPTNPSFMMDENWNMF